MTYAGLTREQLAALERAATPGLWWPCGCKCGRVMQPGGEAIVRQFSREQEAMLADAALIAAARNALPELLAHFEELEEIRFRLMREREEMLLAQMAAAQHR